MQAVRAYAEQYHRLSQSGIHSYKCPARWLEIDCKWSHSSRPPLHRHRHRPSLGVGPPRSWNSQRSSRRPAEQRKSPGSPVLISLFLSRCSASGARFERLVFYTYDSSTPASVNHKTELGTDGVAVLCCVRRVKEAAGSRLWARADQDRCARGCRVVGSTASGV